MGGRANSGRCYSRSDLHVVRQGFAGVCVSPTKTRPPPWSVPPRLWFSWGGGGVVFFGWGFWGWGWFFLGGRSPIGVAPANCLSGKVGREGFCRRLPRDLSCEWIETFPLQFAVQEKTLPPPGRGNVHDGGGFVVGGGETSCCAAVDEANLVQQEEAAKPGGWACHARQRLRPRLVCRQTVGGEERVSDQNVEKSVTGLRPQEFAALPLIWGGVSGMGWHVGHA